MMVKQIEDLLYESFDRELAPDERKRLDDALKSSDTLRHKKNMLEKMRRQLTSAGADASFRPFFADRVMRAIHSQNETKTSVDPFWESLIGIFRPVAISVAIAVIVLLSYNIWRSQSISLASVLGEPDISFEQALNPTFALTME
jgi:hypothetical protein